MNGGGGDIFTNWQCGNYLKHHSVSCVLSHPISLHFIGRRKIRVILVHVRYVVYASIYW
jgi:hypothetical protein